MALMHSDLEKLGSDFPSFELLDVFGVSWSSKSLASSTPALVMFICNHCPYVKAIEDRLIKLGQDLKVQGIPVIAISSNDSTHYIEDSLENLRKRAVQKAYPFKYLHDQDQSVARKFEAVCTPDFFLYDKNLKLSYRGRLDDSWKDESLVSQRELYNWALALKTEGPLPAKQTPSMGCSIKWRSP